MELWHLSFLASTLDRGEWLCSGPCRFPLAKEPRYPPNWKLCSLHSQYGYFAEEKNIFPISGFEPRILATIWLYWNLVIRMQTIWHWFSIVLSDMGQSYYSLSGHGGLATSCRSWSSVKTVHGSRATYCTEITSFIRGRCEEPPVSLNCCWTHPRGNSTQTAHSGFLYTMSYCVCNAVKTRLPGRRETSRSA